MRLAPVFLAAALAWGSFPVHAQSIQVTLLGTGTPRPAVDRMGPATLVEAGDERLLFDVGRGTTIRLVQAGVVHSSVTAVFLTHFHSDHLVGLPDLWLLGHVGPFHRGQPLELFGPRGTRSMAAGLAEAFARDIEIRAAFERDMELRSNQARQGPQLVPKEFHEAGVVLERGGVRVTAFPVDHVEDSYGYRVDYKGASVVISGDARPSETLVTAATDADLLVHEIMALGEEWIESRPEAAQSMMRQVLSTHTTPAQMAEILREAGPRLAVFNHVALIGITEGEVLDVIRSTYDGRMEMGEDLMTILIGDEIEVRRR